MFFIEATFFRFKKFHKQWLKLSVLWLFYNLDKKNEKQKIYEFNGHYYLNWKSAKDDLINAIYQRSEKYVQNKKLFVSITSKDDVWKLPVEIAEAKICGVTGDSKNCITIEQYDEKLAN